MSTKATAAPVTAPPTENADAPVIPGREDVLKEFAAEALGAPPEEKVSDDDAKAKADEKAAAEKQALSQSGEKDITEPKWTEAQESWFAERATAKSPEEIAAAEEKAPEFTPEQLQWLNDKGAVEIGEPAKAGDDDHLKDDAELKGKLDAETQSKINKRISKEVGKTKAEREAREAAEAKAIELQKQIEENGGHRAAAPANVPLGNVVNNQQLEEARAKAEDALMQSEQLLETLEDDPDSVEEALRAAKVELPEYSQAQMKKFLRTVKTNADTVIRKHVPEREKFLKVAEATAGRALELMPELKDKTSPRFAKFQQAQAAMPGVHNDANWPLICAVHVLGMETLEAQQTLKARTAQRGNGKRELPLRIPQPRAAAAQPQRQPANDVPENGEVVDKALNGDKSARRKYLGNLVRGMKF